MLDLSVKQRYQQEKTAFKALIRIGLKKVLLLDEGIVNERNGMGSNTKRTVGLRSGLFSLSLFRTHKLCATVILVE